MDEIYIKIADDEKSTNEPIEFLLEDDKTIFLSSISAQYPGASGLKYRNPATQTIRGLKLVDGKIYMPQSQDLWQDYLYIAAFPNNKRKIEGFDSEGTKSKLQKKCCDLIVLGLPYTMNEDELGKYFSEFGTLDMTYIKRDENGDSRGYGFIRYSTYEEQEIACKRRHQIQGRWCEVKVPRSKESRSSPKIFVGGIEEGTTSAQLSNYFSTYGKVEDVFIQLNPFRGFAFVTFEDSDIANSLIGQNHVIDGVRVYINNADDKNTKRQQQQNRLEDSFNSQQYGQQHNYWNKQNGYGQRNNRPNNKKNKNYQKNNHTKSEDNGPGYPHNSFKPTGDRHYFDKEALDNTRDNTFNDGGPNKFNKRGGMKDFQQNNRGFNDFSFNDGGPNKFNKHGGMKDFQQNNRGFNDFSFNDGGPNKFNKHGGMKDFQQNNRGFNDFYKDGDNFATDQSWMSNYNQFNQGASNIMPSSDFYNTMSPNVWNSTMSSWNSMMSGMMNQFPYK